MRGLSTHYLKGYNNTKKFRVKLTMMKSEKEFLEICDEILRENSTNQLLVE